MLSPNVDNYLYGRGHLLFQPSGATGLIHLGNVPDLGITVGLEKEAHYSSMEGTRAKDHEIIKEKSAKSTISLEEFSAENLNIAWMGNGVVNTTQAAAALDGQSVTTVADKFVELGKYGVYCTRMSHGAVTDGPFDVGETITGGTSAKTAKVAWVGSGFLELISVSGAFTIGETITGGGSAATAVVTASEQVEDVVVTDHATVPTVRYVLGSDYSFVKAGGLIRELTGGDIAAHTAFVSADIPAKTMATVNALKSTVVNGRLLFIGNPDDGPKMRVEGWNVNLTITGEAKIISEGISAIPMEAEYLNDSANHPDNPFFKATTIA